VLNSFVFDYAVRQRVSGRDLRPFQLKPVAVPQPSAIHSVLVIESLSLGGATSWIYDFVDRWSDLWIANRSVAEAYGLTPDDFEYILSTFPVFARKRPEFYAYLQERVKEWKGGD